MAIFYYNGTAALGTGDGSSAANASNNSATAITALGSKTVEVTAGTFTLSAAQANGKTITGAGNVAVTALSSTLAADLGSIAVSGTMNGAFTSSGTFTGNLGNLTIAISSGAVLSATDTVLVGAGQPGPSFNGNLAITNASATAANLSDIAARTIGQVSASAVTMLT